MAEDDRTDPFEIGNEACCVVAIDPTRIGTLEDEDDAVAIAGMDRLEMDLWMGKDDAAVAHDFLLSFLRSRTPITASR